MRCNLGECNEFSSKIWSVPPLTNLAQLPGYTGGEPAFSGLGSALWSNMTDSVLTLSTTCRICWSLIYQSLSEEWPEYAIFFRNSQSKGYSDTAPSLLHVLSDPYTMSLLMINSSFFKADFLTLESTLLRGDRVWPGNRYLLRACPTYSGLKEVYFTCPTASCWKIEMLRTAILSLLANFSLMLFGEALAASLL